MGNRQTIARKLDYMGIRTAAQFADKKESWVRSHFNITTLRTWKELNGESCISIEELPQKKSICTSRSFANEGITDKNVIEEAVANFAVRCTEKLKRQGSLTRPSSPARPLRPHRPKQAKKLMEAIDAINRKNGYGTIRQAIQGTNSRWMRAAPSAGSFHGTRTSPLSG